MENIYSIDTEPNGTTVVVTQSHMRIEFTAAASAELCDHLLNAMNVTMRHDAQARRWTSHVEAPTPAQLKAGQRKAGGK